MLLESHYNSIPWVLHIPSKRSGPRVGISCLTHGWETAGLQAIEFLLQEFNIQSKLLHWELFFSLNNIEWYKKILATGDFWASRYIDENMNRSAQEDNIYNWQSYESKRLQELYPLFSSIDYHIDLHSTPLSSNSMAIYSSKSKDIFSDILNVDSHYSALTDHQQWKAVIDIAERHWGIWLWLESWKESDAEAYHNCIDNILRILAYLWSIDSSTITSYLLPHKKNLHYNIYTSVVVENPSTFRLLRSFKQDEYIAAWTILAYQDNQAIVAPQDSLIVLPSKKLYPQEEYCFLAYAH